MDTSGFYKLLDGQIYFAPNFVYGATFTLLREDKDSYTYPVDGWSWYNSKEDAMNALLPPDKPFYYSEGNYYIDSREAAQLDFNGLVTLTKLKLDNKIITEIEPIYFRDYYGAPRMLPAKEFISMIIQYGDYCVSLRNLTTI